MSPKLKTTRREAQTVVVFATSNVDYVAQVSRTLKVEADREIVPRCDQLEGVRVLQLLNTTSRRRQWATPVPVGDDE